MEFFTTNLAPIMFAGLILFLLMGFPVAFSLGACGLFFAFIGIELGVLPEALLQALPLRIFGIMQNDTLLAIPFFTLMGLILERSGMAEDLLDTIGQLFGPIRGGLALAVIFVGTLLAATTGVVAASVISMGLISLPIMLRYGYDRRIATGVIAASGTLALIIPPSLVLLFVLSLACALAFARTRPATMPTDELVVLSMSVGVGVAFVLAVLNKGLKLGLLSRMAERVTFVLIPPLALIFLVLGTIFLGVATPTEGGAMGATGALIMALSRKRLTLPLMRSAMDQTMKLSCFVLFILIGSTVFSLSFQGVDGPKWVEHLLTSLPGGQVGFLIVVNLLIFFLAFFLDFFELSFIVVPLLAPVADKLGIDLVWFGVLLAVNMQTSFMHPPFGFALFFLRSVAPTDDYKDRVTGRNVAKVTTGQIYWGAVPFVLIQIVMVGLIIIFPNLVSGGLAVKKAVDTSNVVIEVQPTDQGKDQPVDMDALFGKPAGASAPTK